LIERRRDGDRIAAVSQRIQTSQPD